MMDIMRSKKFNKIILTAVLATFLITTIMGIWGAGEQNMPVVLKTIFIVLVIALVITACFLALYSIVIILMKYFNHSQNTGITGIISLVFVLPFLIIGWLNHKKYQITRQMTYITLAIPILVFAFFSHGWLFNITRDIRSVPGQGVIGVVNGEKIQWEKFRDARWQNIQQIKQQKGDAELTERDYEQATQKAWDDIVSVILQQKEIRKRGIRVTDPEISFQIRHNPPDFITKAEAFQTNGQFDTTKFQQALSNPDVPWLQVEEYMRSLLPFQKLQDQVLATVRVTDMDLRQDYVNKNEKVKVRYLFTGPQDFTDAITDVPEQELSTYYNDHKEDFKQAAQRKLRYVMFTKAASRADSTDVKQRIDDLYGKIKAGEDFGELASIHSEDPGSRENNGDLGFFKRGSMVKPFEDAAFRLPIGGLSEPVQSQFGWHLIKITDRKEENGEEQVKASHILLKIGPSEETLDAQRMAAEEFAQSLADMPFDSLAGSKGLPVQESRFFEKASTIPGLGYLPAVANFAFRSDIGATTEVQEDEKAFYVFQLADQKKEGLKPFEEVKEQVKTAALKDRRMALAKSRAAQIATSLKGSSSLEQVASADSLEVKETDFFARSGFVAGVGKFESFIGAAFGLQPNEISDMIETTRGYYFVQQIARQPIDESKFAAEKESLKQALLQQKKNDAYTQWFNALKESAEIVDFRDMYF